MAHPERRQLKTRRDKRRAHDVAVIPQIARDLVTGENHLYHRTHWYGGKLHYRGQVLIGNTRNAE